MLGLVCGDVVDDVVTGEGVRVSRFGRRWWGLVRAVRVLQVAQDVPSMFELNLLAPASIILSLPLSCHLALEHHREGRTQSQG